MTQVFVKWLYDDKWDVYPLKSLADAATGLRLMFEPGSFDELRGRIHDGRKANKAAAELLHIGK